MEENTQPSEQQETTSAPEAVETAEIEKVSYKGVDIPKDVYQSIVDSVQRSINDKHKNQLAKITGVEDASGVSVGDLMKKLSDKLDTYTTGDMELKQETPDVDIEKRIEIERAKIEAEFKKKEQSIMADLSRRQNYDSIKSHAIQAGLAPDMTELIDSIIEKNYAVEMMDNKTYFKNKKTDELIFGENGDAASAEAVAKLIKRSYPSLFITEKPSLGARASSQAAPGPLDRSNWDSTPIEDLLK